MIDISPSQNMFLQEWLRQAAKTPRPPHKELGAALDMTTQNISNYKRNLVNLGVLVRTGPCRYAMPDNVGTRVVSNPKAAVPNSTFKQFVKEFDQASDSFGRSPTQTELATILNVSRQRVGQLFGLAMRLGYLQVMRTSKKD